jgi:hypothetical protein
LGGGSIRRVAKLIRDGMKMLERHHKALVELLEALLVDVSRCSNETRDGSILTVFCGRRCVGDIIGCVAV